MGFEIIGAQAQDTSPNIGIKNGPSTSNRPLMVSPKMQAQNEDPTRPFKRLVDQGIRIRGKHPISTNQESKIFPNYCLSIIPY